MEALADQELEELCAHADAVPPPPPRDRKASDPMGVAAAAEARGDDKRANSAVPTALRAAQMQELLAQVSDEVCDQPRAPSLDTGELIRVEETLAIAGQAAREAVALRRMQHERSAWAGKQCAKGSD